MTTRTAPIGVATRGTTAPRRLRRVDRWLAATYPVLLATPQLLAIDLGFGSRPVTTLELAARLRRTNPSAAVLGLEIDPDRVAAASPFARAGVSFAQGGFELAGRRPHLVRAFNVLRQYDEADVPDAWTEMCSRIDPLGVVVEGTCDESGRLAGWVTLDAAGPRTLTLAVDLAMAPSAVAARLPKALIHRNVAGEAVHEMLDVLDEGWHRRASLSAFGSRQRFAAAVELARERGWPIVDGPSRWRRGELTVKWAAVRPLDR